MGHWRKIRQGPPSCPVHQVAWEWESWHQWRKLQCVEKSLHYLQIRKSILVIADTKDIAHAGKLNKFKRKLWCHGYRMLSHAIPKFSFCLCVTLEYCSWCFLGINSDDYGFPFDNSRSSVSALLLKDSSYRHFVSLGLAKMPWRRVSWLSESSQITPTKHSARLGWTRFLKISSAHTPAVQVLCIYPFFSLDTEVRWVNDFLVVQVGDWLSPQKILVWTLAPRVSIAWHVGCGPKKGQILKSKLLKKWNHQP